jgi:FlaA1/EpsC-like NDP-sugar epimerase
MKIDIEYFIKKHITKRVESLFNNDLESFDSVLKEKIDSKSVLVIGGAGTIGSNYIKAILKFKIKKLIVVDINENGLTELVRDLRSSSEYIIPDTFITYPIDFGDKVFKKIFLNHGPFQIISNFAAHKHVRSEKDIFSIEAMIENNVLKAKNLLDILLENPPEHFFCVSTDKAANPVNIMGASKKLMEELILTYSSVFPIKTARFANVAFSNGSLPLGFVNRINKNQPLSCPLGIRRFFISPIESGQLCLIASILGESGDIFFPKLDEKKDMILFDKIAIDFLNYLDLKADVCITEEEAIKKSHLIGTKTTNYPIYFFESDTSGEKSFEEFYTQGEILDFKRFNELGVIKNSSKRNIDELNLIFNKLNKVFSKKNVLKNDVVKALKSFLPNFDHIETGKNLDQKM